MSSLNIKICDIVSDGLYTMSYKTGANPCPTNDGFTTIGTGLTASTITLTGLTFNTQYWIKMVDETTNRYIIRNIETNHSKTFPCYDTMCFNVEADCDIFECQCKTFNIEFSQNCDEILYFTSCDGDPMAVQANYFPEYSTTTFSGGTFVYVCSCTTPVIDCTGVTITQVSSTCIAAPTPTPTVTPTKTPTPTPTVTPTKTPTPTPSSSSSCYWTVVDYDGISTSSSITTPSSTISLTRALNDFSPLANGYGSGIRNYNTLVCGTKSSNDNYVLATTWKTGTTLASKTYYFSPSINNPVYTFYNLASGSTLTITTSTPYDVICSGSGVTYNSNTSFTASNGFGSIRFNGTFSSITLTPSTTGSTPIGYTEYVWGTCDDTITPTPTVTPTKTPTPTPTPTPCSDDISGYSSTIFNAYGVQKHPTLNRVFVSGYASSPSSRGLYYVDSSNLIAQSIDSTLDTPSFMTVNTTDNKLYLNVNNGLKVYSTSSNTLIQTITGRSSYFNLGGLAYNSSNNTVYASSFSGGTTGELLIIDGFGFQTFINGLPIKPLSQNGIVYNPISTDLYIMGQGNTVKIFNTGTNTISGSISISSAPLSLSYKQSTNQLFVVRSGFIDVVNCTTNTITTTWTIPSIGDYANSITYNTINNRLYITNYVDAVGLTPAYGNVLVVNATTGILTKTISLPSVGVLRLGGITFTPDNSVFVANPNGSSGQVIKICGSV